jgi:predicted nucleic acid-binding protein
MIFLDTNILVYALDTRENGKTSVCRRLLGDLGARGLARTNLQVLNELTNVLLRKGLVPAEDIRDHWSAFAAFGDSPLTPAIAARAWPVRLVSGFSWLDCLMIASAVALDCRFLLSEDLIHGYRTGDIVILNPFRIQPGDLVSVG